MNYRIITFFLSIYVSAQRPQLFSRPAELAEEGTTRQAKFEGISIRVMDHVFIQAYTYSCPA